MTEMDDDKKVSYSNQKPSLRCWWDVSITWLSSSLSPKQTSSPGFLVEIMPDCTVPCVCCITWVRASYHAADEEQFC